MTYPPSFDPEPIAPLLHRTPQAVRYATWAVMAVLALVVAIVTVRGRGEE